MSSCKQEKCQNPPFTQQNYKQRHQSRHEQLSVMKMQHSSPELMLYIAR